MVHKNFIGQIHEFNRYNDNFKEEIKLDLTDRKIIYLLSLNSRISDTFIAKVLRIKRETVAYRIKRMINEDFLHGTLTLLDHRKLGYKNYLIYIKLKKLVDEEALLNFLMGLNEVTRLKNCSGIYDLQAIFTVKDEEEFTAYFDKVISKYPESIQNYDIMEILEENFLGLEFMLNNEEKNGLNKIESKGSSFQKEFANIKPETEVKLDENDKKILEELKLNGELSIKNISLKIGLDQGSVKDRIKNLVLSGVIKKFVPIASLAVLGYQWWKVFFKFKNLNKAKFLTFIKLHPNILWYMRLLGKYDYQVSVFAKDNSDFHKVLDEFRIQFADEIITYDSIVVFNQFKYVQRI